VDYLDLLILVLVVAAAVGGHRLGFLGRAISWIGLAAGFYLAVRLLPNVVVPLRSSSPSVLAIVAVATLVIGAMLGQTVGLAVGARLHRALPPGPVRQMDRVVGGLLGAAGVLVVVWLLIPSIAEIPGWPSREISGSAISRWEADSLPPPPDAVQVLRRVIGGEAPQVFADLAPGLPAGPPPSASPFGAARTAQLVDSTVKVEGEACGNIYEGSGFAVAPDLVVTNAHVVAGEGRSDTQVRRPDGRTLSATVVLFDPRRDLALLDVPRLEEAPLPLGAPAVGMTGAVLGHPHGVDPTVADPARVVQIIEATGFDIYDSHETTRQVLVLAAALAHGDSGAPVLDAAGRVVGVAFEIAANNPDTAYALSSSELDADLASPRVSTGVSTGSCLAD
jgi:S1-C subfamily serine protease